MRIGVLTGGGDCPGLNAVIRAAVRKGVREYGHTFTGFKDGWRGPLEGDSVELPLSSVRGILARGGTILGSSRTNPLHEEDGPRKIIENLTALGVDALIVMGGEDTLGVAAALHGQGLPVVGVPKTIDNDLAATDYTFGFDTAVSIATDALDRLRTTAESHHRAVVCEVMGRHAGWIALHAGLAGGADVILIPERPFDLARVVGWVEARFRRGLAAVLCVSEGAAPVEGDMTLQEGGTDAFGHVRLGGVGSWLGERLQDATGREARTTVLGHLQRGGAPTAFDRVLATRFGLHAVDAVQDGAFGTMVALRGTEIVRAPLSEAVATLKTVPPGRYDEVEVLFG
ncbi:6-phosphofructokinase [Actinocorallia sp. API 0066]|uniref:6-phosphofructokinase n=1 Tax=Actinocorallia sp. API 0066 TaxID=2896846 RepID=UPI001E4A506E|nr:6-phosphofructokinase [Actinocorallia sp. API 0066]MCD0450965.1 6-phosphofructokinase [Actinocorallia sp. API 0066]